MYDTGDAYVPYGQSLELADGLRPLKAVAEPGALAQWVGVVALLGHTDTVFPAGTVAARPFRREGMRCFGPGVADMKGGLVLAAMAMETCAARQRPFQELRLLVCADEEVRLRAPAGAEHQVHVAEALVVRPSLRREAEHERRDHREPREPALAPSNRGVHLAARGCVQSRRSNLLEPANQRSQHLVLFVAFDPRVRG